ncbi:hypothetical protein ACJX0J_009193, partial [Zea mays]
NNGMVFHSTTAVAAAKIFSQFLLKGTMFFGYIMHNFRVIRKDSDIEVVIGITGLTTKDGHAAEQASGEACVAGFEGILAEIHNIHYIRDDICIDVHINNLNQSYNILIIKEKNVISTTTAAAVLYII